MKETVLKMEKGVTGVWMIVLGVVVLAAWVLARPYLVAAVQADDPAMTFSTYYGGSTEECLFERCAIATDAAGNIYVTGTTRSPDFPIVNEFASDSPDGSGEDVFLVKLSPSGTIIYSTYIGNGEARGVTVDAQGNAYVVGATGDANFPTTPNALQTCRTDGSVDLFVVKLSADGQTLLYGSCLGGGKRETGFGIALDGDGNMLVTGFTESDDFPTVDAAQADFAGGFDVVVAKISAAGDALIYSTYLGGERRDRAYVVVTDATGNAYIGGRAESADFPTTAGVVQATGTASSQGYIAKLSPTGSLLYSSYVPAENRFNNGEVSDIEVDGDGNVHALYVSTSFRGIIKFNAAASGLVYTEEVDIDFVIDGENNLVLDDEGNAFVVGQRDEDGKRKEVVVAAVTASGRNSFEKSFGGSDADQGMDIALVTQNDGRVDAYVVGVTESSDFPTLNPLAGGDALKGDSDLFIFNLTGMEAVVEVNDIYLPLVVR